MRAVHVDGSLSVRSVPAPEPGPGEALVRVRLSGICNTDVEIVRGYMGFRGVLGHEFVGEVAAVGDAADLAWVGRRVVGEINLGCGSCPRCRRDLARHCPRRAVLGIVAKDGCHAGYVTLPVGNLHAVPDAVSDECAVFTEPLAAAFEVLEQMHVEPGARVIVLGDGKLGLLVAKVLQGVGSDVTVVGRHPRKRALAGSWGLTARGVDDEVAGDADVVVEATGSPQGLDRALSLVRPRGTVVLKSTFHGAVSVATSRLVIDEVTLRGSRCGPFGPALRALERGSVDPRGLIDTTYALDDAEAAFARAQSPGVLKVLLDHRAT